MGFGRIKPAFTLIEIIIDIGVLSLILVAVFSGFSAAYKSVSGAKAKITAVALANEKMEIIRNMPYDSVGTVSGSYPPGIIPDQENISRNNINFIVDTEILYVDDPFDGTINTSPADVYPYDYKKIEISVKRATSGVNLITLTSNLAASAAETETDTGILYLCVFDAENQPVPGAGVNITNDDIVPPLNLDYETGLDGCVMVPKLPPDSHNNYHLIITKDGYSTAMTYPRTAQNPNQLHEDIDIISQQVTRVNMSIDLVSSLTIKALDLTGNPVPNISVHLQDDYEIYFNPSTMRYSEDHVLDASGETTVSDLAFANFTVSINTAGYYLSSSNPYIPFYLAPDASQTVILYLTTSSSAPTIEAISPESGKIIDAITIMVDGSNFQSPMVMKLINSGTGTEIVANDVEVHAGKQVSGIFDLTLGSIGTWDVFVQNPNNEFARKVAGFEITN